MPRLWNETIEAHRRDVRQAILDAAADVVSREGLLAVTMSRIAAEAGIGRATLYKYFGDAESILAAWHERQVSEHVASLLATSERDGTPASRLAAVLEEYARLCYASRQRHDHRLAALLHRGREGGEPARGQVLDLIVSLIDEAARAGVIRSDVASEELAEYCLHALAAAEVLDSAEAVRRLVSLTVSALLLEPGADRQ